MKREAEFLCMFSFCILFFISIVSADVKINEFETNPTGADAGNEWVELYNNGTNDVNLDGWTVMDKTNQVVNLSGNISAKSYYVFNWTNGTLNNTNQNLTLKNNIGLILDITINASDTDDDDNSWSRISDGFDTNSNSDWIFQTSTTGAKNDFIPPTIQNQNASPAIAFNETNIILTANITDNFRVESVWVEANWTGSFVNYTVTNNISSNYSFVIQAGNLSDGQSFVFRFYANDSSGNLGYGSFQIFILKKRTSLAIVPSVPDGLNGWYVTIPTFILTPDPSANTTYYRFDALTFNLYIGPFLFDINITLGGIERLDYFSTFDSINESIQNFTVKVDITNPQIINLQPANSSSVFNSTPQISAYLDEVFQGNSGINQSSVVMKVDGVIVPAIVSTADTIDATVKFTPANLTLGIHNVTVNVSDYAGRNSELTWFFFVNSTTFNLTVYSPNNTLYTLQRILFNITTSSESEKIEYINYKSSNPKFKKLCDDCNEYGNSRERKVTLEEGENNITIKVTDHLGNVVEKNIVAFVDSKISKISKTLPKKESVTNGSEFSIKYTEINLKNITLFYGNSTRNITNYTCSSGRNKDCFFNNINITEFNGKFIDYWFAISDFFNIVESKKLRIFVDTASPVLTVFSPVNTTYEDKVPFIMTVNESVTLEYFDTSDSFARWRTLCRRCLEYGLSTTKTKSFREGSHIILIRAVDDAGNSDLHIVSFNVSG